MILGTQIVLGLVKNNFQCLIFPVKYILKKFLDFPSVIKTNKRLFLDHSARIKKARAS